MAILTVTNTQDSGAGSLRNTIAQAQAGDVIQFDPALANSKITLTSGDIDITKSITIDGSTAAGLTLSGNQSSRIFNVLEKQIDVAVKSLTFVDGRAVEPNNFEDEGGAIKVADYSTLTVENSTFQNNSANRGGGIRVGYGGSLTVRSSTFDGNDGSLANDGFSAGAIATYGAGGPTGEGKLVIEGSTFTNNKGVNGGAIYNLLGPVTIKDSVFQNNQSVREGGAVFTDGVSGSELDQLGGSLTIEGSTFANNQSTGGGGALYLWTHSGDTVLIKDSTIMGNTVTRGTGDLDRGRGGGIEFAGSNLTVENTTIAENTSAVQGGGLWVNNNAAAINLINATVSGNKALDDAGGGMFLSISDGVPVKITNSTIAKNFAGRDAGAIWTGGQNKDVTLTNTLLAENTAEVTKQGHTNFTLLDGGGNIVETLVEGRGPLVTANSLYVDDLQLGDLQLIGNDYVHPLLADSPAINAGTVNGAPAGDQRQVLRDGQPDSGAFEFTNNETVVQAITNIADSDSDASDLSDLPDGLGGEFTPNSESTASDGFATATSIDFTQGEPGEKLSGTNRRDMLSGEAGNDRITGRAENDQLDGGAGNDQLSGGNGDDELLGGEGHDLLQGRAGNDNLTSGNGNDILIGGKGADVLSGGEGSDTFVFQSITKAIDTIIDFNSTEDTIDLRQIFAKSKFAGESDLDRFTQFVRLEQDGDNTVMQLDTDGNGAETTFTTLANLNNVSADSLSTSNFVVS